MTCNASLPTLPSRESLEETLVFRPSFVSTLPHWTPWAAHFRFVPQTRDLQSITISFFLRNYVPGHKRALLKDISSEEGGADVSIDAKAESFTVRNRRRLLLTLEEKSSPCGPYLPGTFHSMGAVRKHTLSIGSKKGPNAIRSAFPTNFGGSQHRSLQDTPSTKHSGRDL